MRNKVTYTPEQYREKVLLPLSPCAFIAFILMDQGKIRTNAGVFARSATPEEWDAMEWLKMLGGMKLDASPEELEALGEEVVSEINKWLQEDDGAAARRSGRPAESDHPTGRRQTDLPSSTAPKDEGLTTE